MIEGKTANLRRVCPPDRPRRAVCTDPLPESGAPTRPIRSRDRIHRAYRGGSPPRRRRRSRFPVGDRQRGRDLPEHPARPTSSLVISLPWSSNRANAVSSVPPSRWAVTSRPSAQKWPGSSWMRYRERHKDWSGSRGNQGLPSGLIRVWPDHYRVTQSDPGDGYVELAQEQIVAIGDQRVPFHVHDPRAAQDPRPDSVPG